MFNWSWNLRGQTGYLSPVGPNFSWAPTKHLYINDTHISVKLPKQQTVLPVQSITQSSPWRTDALDDRLYEFNGVRSRSVTALMRQWDFNGPWFTGHLGGITMSAIVVCPADIPEGLNYFHPRALEAGIADQLTSWYGSKFSADRSRQKWHAPMNWRQCHNFPGIAARFEAVNALAQSRGPHCFLAVPVAKTHFLLIAIRIDRSNVFSDIKPKPTIDEWIDPKPFLTLANQVLDSVQVTLSPQAQAEQEEALQGLNDKTLVKDYPPVKWTATPIVEDEN
jgi:hypothetical protein